VTVFWELNGYARFAKFNRFPKHASIAAAFLLVVILGLRGSGFGDERDRE
jgi:hypothetical protein